MWHSIHSATPRGEGALVNQFQITLHNQRQIQGLSNSDEVFSFPTSIIFPKVIVMNVGLGYIF